ncbi:hypothetical protein AMATHDRAFT_58422 [Amanita thiersii Skay4041]|uniref:Mid2 domain-containing protein n=1 Tax=Amanita thiersii Skay4041 TaxID=703135 RepID=A0A2A9NVH6_9AGAR|nr:hypothetical protein AMATHDRAFT_58422 [Amanita thiersii Skay4041]
MSPAYALTLSMIWSILLLLNTANAATRLVNRTIDDKHGDEKSGTAPTYFPLLPGVWADQDHNGRIAPDPVHAFQNTFIAATYHPEYGHTSVTFDFIGSAIYVFFTIVDDARVEITSKTECNFTVDGNIVGYYNHDPDLKNPAFHYQQLVFQKDDLSPGHHTFSIVTSDVPYHVYINFDYAMYTTEEIVGPPSANPLLPVSTSNAKITSTSTSLSTTSSGSTGPSSISITTSISNSGSPPISATQSTPTVDGPTSSPFNSSLASSSGMNNASFIGGIVGGSVSFVVVIVLLVWVLLWKRSRRHRVEDLPPHYTADTNGMSWTVQSSSSKGTTESRMAPFAALPRVNFFSKRNMPAEHDGESSDVLQETVQEEVRSQRQHQLTERLRIMMEEMQVLQDDLQVESVPLNSSEEQGNISDSSLLLRAQIVNMERQITQLRQLFQSSWAMGLTDDPPPEYTL